MGAAKHPERHEREIEHHRQPHTHAFPETSTDHVRPLGPSEGDGVNFNMNKYELHNGRRPNSDGEPDAVVAVPINLDPSQKVNFVFLNHGLDTNSKTVYNKYHLGEQMAGAPPNTVFVSMNTGKVTDAGNFDNTVSSLIKNTPGLEGLRQPDGKIDTSKIGNVGVVAFSAGHWAALKELQSSMLKDHIKDVFWAGAFVEGGSPDELNPWIKANKDALKNGDKRLLVMFTGSSRSETFAQQVQDPAVYGTDGLYLDMKDPSHLSQQGFNTRGIVVKRSEETVDKLGDDKPGNTDWHNHLAVLRLNFGDFVGSMAGSHRSWIPLLPNANQPRYASGDVRSR